MLIATGSVCCSEGSMANSSHMVAIRYDSNALISIVSREHKEAGMSGTT